MRNCRKKKTEIVIKVLLRNQMKKRGEMNENIFLNDLIMILIVRLEHFTNYQLIFFKVLEFFCIIGNKI